MRGTLSAETNKAKKYLDLEQRICKFGTTFDKEGMELNYMDSNDLNIKVLEQAGL